MKIDFEFETPYGKFADALWFPDGETLPSDAEIEAMKQQNAEEVQVLFYSCLFFYSFS